MNRSPTSPRAPTRPAHALREWARLWLPDGLTLPEAEWQRRHQAIVALLWTLAGAMPIFGVTQGHPLDDEIMGGAALAFIAMLAHQVRGDRLASSALASLGLCTASALAVHTADGAIEAHFMFFVVIIVISLYEDWRPFLLAFGFVVLHHGVMGILDRNSTYNHDGNPWVLALIHGAFVAAAAIACLVHWRLNEKVRSDGRRDSARATESDARFRSSFEDGPIGMAVVKTTDTGLGTLLQINRTLCRQLGHSEEGLKGTDLQALIDPGSIATMRRHIDALIAAEEIVGGHESSEITVTHDELRLVRHGGSSFDGRVSMSLVAGDTDIARDLIVQIEDVTERNRLKTELQDLADHDPLTGLVNRRRFGLELSKRLDSGRREPAGGAVILIDLDGFKEINDILGHEAGDQLLVSVAAALRQVSRSEDVVARLGGDEFALLIGATTAPEANGIGQRIVARLHQHSVSGVGPDARRATASVGVVVYSAETELSDDQLLNDADLAMYDAKDKGGNRCVVYCVDPGPTDAAGGPPSWPDRIRRALADERFVMYAQPILDLQSREITNFELLLRMIGPDGEIIPPAAFLPIAERRGMIRPIDRWVIRQAVDLLREITFGALGGDDRPARLHVNISGRSLTDEEFLRYIRAELRRTGVDPTQLVFEVTETAAIANVADACRFLTSLSELGCGIALDDFGAGFGSLLHLRHLPVDFVKIDGQFIQHLTTSPDDLVVVESLVQMSTGLNMQTTAEYVENADTLALVADLGVDFAQGYHVGRPGPARQVIRAARATPALHPPRR